MTTLTRYLTAGVQPPGHHQLPPLFIQAHTAVNEGLMVNPFTLETWTEWEAV